jgi:hypothetical protein
LRTLEFKDRPSIYTACTFDYSINPTKNLEIGSTNPKPSYICSPMSSTTKGEPTTDKGERKNGAEDRLQILDDKGTAGEGHLVDDRGLPVDLNGNRRFLNYPDPAQTEANTKNTTGNAKEEK